MRLSPQTLVYVGLADAATAHTLGAANAVAVTDAQLLAWGGFLLALGGLWYNHRRDARDRERQRDADEAKRAAERRVDDREREEVRQRQELRHAENQTEIRALKTLVDDLHRELHRRGGLLDKEELNREARHDRRNEAHHVQLRFAHNEQWMAHVSRCSALPLPPYAPLPPMPQRRHGDGG